MDRDQTRHDLLNGSSPDMQRRRAVICLSLFGIALMALGTLRQTGTLKHLPDPPGKLWDADKVVTSDEGYPFGVPDAPIAIASFATNILAASIGGEDRKRKLPFVPILAAGKALLDVLVSGWYLSKMPSKIKAWCPYCLLTSATNVTIAGLTAIEAMDAITESR